MLGRSGVATHRDSRVATDCVSGEVGRAQSGDDGLAEADVGAEIDAVEEHRRGLEATIREQRRIVADLVRDQERLLAAAEREDSQAKRALALVTREHEHEAETLQRLEAIHRGLLEETAAWLKKGGVKPSRCHA